MSGCGTAIPQGQLSLSPSSFLTSITASVSLLFYMFLSLSAHANTITGHLMCTVSVVHGCWCHNDATFCKKVIFHEKNDP